MRRGLFGSFVPVVALAALLAAPAAAQDATPRATPAAGAPSAALEVVAAGLTHPRGFVWGADGTLYVAQAGTGGTNPAAEPSPAEEAIGPFGGGPTASVVRVEAGCPVPVAAGLPSVVDGMGGVLGAEDLALLGGELYVSVDGGGAAHGNPDQPSGVYRVLADGTAELVADLSAWTRANPVAERFPDYDPDAAGYGMVADEAAGLLWVVNPNAGDLLTVTPDGAVARVADLSAGHPVPTGLALDPEGGVYVGTLTAVPFPDGAASVLHVSPDGAVEEAWTGLTAVVDVAVGPDGGLYALELSTGNLEQPPFLVPGSGRVVRQTGPDAAEPVAEGLVFPITLAVGPDGGLYVAFPAVGAPAAEGAIARLGAANGGMQAVGVGTPEAPHAPVGTPSPCAGDTLATPAA